MKHRSAALLLLALGWGMLFGQNPCANSANRNLTGTWYEYKPGTTIIFNIITFNQDGTPAPGTPASVSGGAVGTAITGHQNAVTTFLNGTFDGTTFQTNYSVVELQVHGSGTISAALSNDGNTLTGQLKGSITFNGNQMRDTSRAIVWVRATSMFAVAPNVLPLAGAAGGAAVDTSLTLYNCGNNPLTFTAVATTASNGNWLAVEAPNNNIGAGQSIQLFVRVSPGKLTASANPYVGYIQISGQAGNASTATAIVNFQVSDGRITVSVPTALSFTANAGGAAPAPRSITVLSTTGAPVVFSITADSGAGTAAPPWLNISLTNGSTPGLITVTVDPSSLAAGDYSARLLVAGPAGTAQQAIVVPLMLTVVNAQPSLIVSPASLRFRSTTSGAGILHKTVVVENVGGGTDDFSVTIPMPLPGLTASPTSGQVTPNSPTSVRVEINTHGLAAGGYKGVVRFTSADRTVDVPVSAFVAKTGAILAVDQTGLRFDYRQGQGLSTPGIVRILDLGDPSSRVDFDAEVANDAPWLSLNPATGTATGVQPGELTVTINADAQTLAPGSYYGLIRISDLQFQNSPQYVVVVLSVAADTTSPEPDPFPRGLVFVGTSGGPVPAAQRVTIYTSDASPVNLQISSSSVNEIPLVAFNFNSSTVDSRTPAILTATANSAQLKPGVYEGQITIAIGSVVRSINVTVIVLATDVAPVSNAASPVCTPLRVVLTETGLPNGFSVPGGFPATLSALMNDDCGNTITDGSVVATFSTGDPALNLASDMSTGAYSATWQPAGNSAQATVTLTGTSGLLAADAVQITGAVSVNPAPPPVLTPDGTVNIFYPAGGLSPGAVAFVSGTGLATKSGTSKSTPLPTSFEGTSMLVGAKEAPLFAVSSEHLKAQIPSELEPGQYNLIANVNGALSLPDTITINRVQPAVMATGDGHAVAHHSNGMPVTAAHPAAPGEAVIIFLVGMGATNPPVASGHAAPSHPAAKVVVQPVVTVHGENAKVSFAELTPGNVGLYQIDFRVPTTAPNGDLDLVVSQDGVAGNATKLPVKK